jgi:hypothetical protein
MLCGGAAWCRTTFSCVSGKRFDYQSYHPTRGPRQYRLKVLRLAPRPTFLPIKARFVGASLRRADLRGVLKLAIATYCSITSSQLQ